MFRPDVAGDDTCGWQFAELRLLVTDRKGLQARSTFPGCDGGNRARIYTAAQENAERNIAHQMTGDSVFQLLAISLNVVFLGIFALWLWTGQLPIRLGINTAGHRHPHDVSWLQFANSLKERFRAGAVAEGEIFR